MSKSILYKFLEPDKAQQAVLSKEKTLEPDYNLYLYKIASDLYVLVDVDYYGGFHIAKDIEKAFSVKLIGWCALREVKKDGELIPLQNFNTHADPNELTDEEWETLRKVIYFSGYKYMLAKVAKV